MVKMPIFPLNTVLFPGVPINLHIFEPRYQQMVRFCLSESQPFGIVLIRKGAEALGPVPEPHDIGCSATIIDTEPLGDGRINISVVGVDRFRIQSLDTQLPYLVGDIEKYPVSGLGDANLHGLAEKLRPWVARYLKLIADRLPEDYEADYIPDDPVSLAYLSAFLVQAPAKAKQTLLEKEAMPDMLRYLVRLYRRETALLRKMVSGEGPVESGFGMN